MPKKAGLREVLTHRYFRYKRVTRRDIVEEGPAASAPAATAPAAAPAAAAPPSSEAQQVREQLADMKAMFEQGLIPSREIYEDKVRQILGLE